MGSFTLVVLLVGLTIIPSQTNVMKSHDDKLHPQQNDLDLSISRESRRIKNPSWTAAMTKSRSKLVPHGKTMRYQTPITPHHAIHSKQFVVNRPRAPFLPFQLTAASFLIPAIPTLVGISNKQTLIPSIYHVFIGLGAGLAWVASQKVPITTNLTGIGSPSTNITVTQTNTNNPTITQTQTNSATSTNTNTDNDTINSSSTNTQTNTNENNGKK